MDRLAGKKALVIGASTGIGREVCRVFALEGADVCIGDLGHDEDKASLVAELTGMGRDAFAVEVDVLLEAQVQAAVDATVARFGRIDIIVNNAGVPSSHHLLHEEPTDEWDFVLNVNLRGVYFGMKYAIPYMKAQGWGRIINTASNLAHRPIATGSSYSASKAGVVALSVVGALELGQFGITVNTVCPGPTDTPMLRGMGAPERLNKMLETLPISRIAEPIEIAWAYVYLASDEGSYCTGQSISPNGGHVMW